MDGRARQKLTALIEDMGSQAQAHLGNARPIDLLTRGRVSDLLRAIEADESGAYA